MKVAVTGANGFIGRHVVAELARLFIPVTMVLRPGASPLAELSHHVIVYLDLADPPPDAFERLGRPDVLIHLAWGGLPNYKSLHHFENELPGQYSFLSGLLRSGLKSLVVSGTCFEYGMQSGPLSEELATFPANPYGFAKDMLRRQLEYLKTEQEFSLTWARLFYLYGEGQNENALYSQLKLAMRRGELVFNMSGGEQLRDYLPVVDVAEKIVALALADKDIGIVNICSGKPISIRNLVENWFKINNWAVSLNLGHYPYPEYEPMAFWGDNRKLNKLLESL